MSLRLHETEISCNVCGSFLWRVTIFMYNTTTQQNEPREDEPVCKKCDKIRYLELMKHAVRIEPLIPAGDVIKTKAGITQRREEQDAK